MPALPASIGVLLVLRLLSIVLERPRYEAVPPPTSHKRNTRPKGSALLGSKVSGLLSKT